MRALRNLSLVSLPALLLTFAFLELVVLRLWVPVDDVPVERYDQPTGILRYRPNQQGVTYPDRDIRNPVPFTVNADGWNSIHPHYDPGPSGKLRVAVVGDSYVAAFEVAPRASLAGQLEALLGQDHAEVFALGIRGAPLSEYLQIARYVVEKYRPDAVVIVIVHNDFDESYRLAPGRYTPAFLHLAVDGENVEEIPPRPYHEPALETWVRTRSRTFRFLFYRLGLGSQQLRSLYGAAPGRPQQFEANVDVRGLAGEEEKMRRVAGYVFGQLARLERSSGTRFVLLMDASRDAIYGGRDPRETRAYVMNRIAAEASAGAGLTFVDLTSEFERDYRGHHLRFEFPHDGHWNARAQALAAREACRALRTRLGEARIECGGEGSGR
ncbi:MAG: SGNH/GDSL hydrolase family protein [Candidatus Binatia bacterium]